MAAGESFALRAGEVASVADGEVLVGFRRVRADSRCPADVTCVWAGDAEVEIGVAPEGGTWAWYSLHTGVEPRAVTVEAFRVRLEGLRPTPTKETAADSRVYVAHLSVARV